MGKTTSWQTRFYWAIGSCLILAFVALVYKRMSGPALVPLRGAPPRATAGSSPQPSSADRTMLSRPTVLQAQPGSEDSLGLSPLSSAPQPAGPLYSSGLEVPSISEGPRASLLPLPAALHPTELDISPEAPPHFFPQPRPDEASPRRRDEEVDRVGFQAWEPESPAERFAAQPVPPTGSSGPTGGTIQLQANDSFWAISERVYGSGAFFRALYEHNRHRVVRPDQLTEGEEIEVPDLSELIQRYPQWCPKPQP